jgi:hypothetical protein
MPRRPLLSCACAFWLAGVAAAADAEAPPKPKPAPPPQSAPAVPSNAADPVKGSAPGRKPIPVHPIRTQTTFVVDPSEIQGAGELGPRVGPITVTLNYFDHLPGIELDKLSPQRRQRVLERANKEPCTCGCKGDTVARCLVNDPACKLVKALAQQIYEEERLRPEAGK